MKNIDLNAIARHAMDNYGFYSRFPANVLREAQGIDPESVQQQLAQVPVKDLRELLWSSIDNPDSRDLDQLEYAERAPNRETRVLIAIADVDLYVTKGTLINRHAYHNATSVYPGVEVFPMLPERLCTDISSLNEHEDRFAVVIEYFVRKDGGVRPGAVFRGRVRNKAKLNYDDIGEWLDGEKDVSAAVVKIDGLEDQLRLQHEAAEQLHELRMAHGALELETIEPRPVFFEGQVRDLVALKKNRARALIENFMIAANTTMVAFLNKHQVPHIQRIVRTPQRWPMIREVAFALDDDLPLEADARALSAFLVRQRTAAPELFADLSLTIIKLLGPGEYVLAEPGKWPIGHFGLAVNDYTHSTAPNRRYVDIVIQRLIKSVLAKERSPYSKGELSDIAAHCTDRDKASKKVERFMRKVAGAVLLQGRLNEIFDGIVTGASEKGTYVRLLAPPVEGRVVRGEAGLFVGQKVRVRLTGLDPEKGFIDLETAALGARDYRFPARIKRQNPRRK